MNNRELEAQDRAAEERAADRAEAIESSIAAMRILFRQHEEQFGSIKPAEMGQILASLLGRADKKAFDNKNTDWLDDLYAIADDMGA